MSRSPRDDARDDVRATLSVDRRPAAERPTASLPIDRLALRPGPTRQPVVHRGTTYQLRDSDVRMLATVGAFRVVCAEDVHTMRSPSDTWGGDLRNLREQALVEVKTVTINRSATAIVVLTRDGKSLLDAHQERSAGRSPQAFHAGLVKPRELAHDAQLYRLFQAEASRIEADGGRVDRVVLDYELKRDYQSFLNRPHRVDEEDGEDFTTFASAYGLPVIDGHLELPDIRIEYETPDGHLHHRDVELVTEHYSRSQLAGKARAGFSMYRAAGATFRSGSARTGGTPFDPHHLEWLG
jgi:hypothetical protein